jgi:Fungal Zn(2)-Cys(6) binuclear cluster domain
MMPGSDLQRPIRKRASKACQECRLRKVKCNLVEVGSPCHNCRLDENECITSVSRRGRKYRRQKDQPKHVRAFQPLLLSQPLQTTPSESSPDSRPGDAADNPVTLFNGAYDLPNILSTDGSHSSSGPAVNSPVKSPPPIVSAVSATARKPISPIGLPSYIRPPQRDLRLDELEFLKSRGALSIPDPPIRDKLLLSFLLYVNPFLPVVDVQEFISAIEGESGAQVSLILFQAVMFAGTAFVDPQVFLGEGFEDRRTGRAHFFQRIKVREDNASQPIYRTDDCT